MAHAGETLLRPRGPSRCRFFKGQKWHCVAVDDYLPITKDGHLCFSRSACHDEMWVSFIEKAYAKLHGGYQVCGPLSACCC